MDTRAKHQHDSFNVVAIGMVNVLFVLAALKCISTGMYQTLFLVYIIVDSVYLLIKPESVAFHKGVLCHHLVVTLLLVVAIRRTDLAYHSMLMGCVEFDTWVMTVRRAFYRHSSVLKVLNNVTFTVTRFGAHPYCWALIYNRKNEPLRPPLLVGISTVILFSLYMSKVKISPLIVNRIAASARLAVYG